MNYYRKGDLHASGWQIVKGEWGSKTLYEKFVGNKRYFAMYEPFNIEHSTNGKTTKYWKITADKVQQTNESKVRRVPLAPNFKHK